MLNTSSHQRILNFLYLDSLKHSIDTKCVCWCWMNDHYTFVSFFVVSSYSGNSDTWVAVASDPLVLQSFEGGGCNFWPFFSWLNASPGQLWTTTKDRAFVDLKSKLKKKSQLLQKTELLISVFILVLSWYRVDPESKDGHTYTTRKGRVIEAQLHFWCVGKRLGNSWIQSSIFSNWLDDNGRLKVDSNMRLVNSPNVFCAGDLTNIQVRL